MDCKRTSISEDTSSPGLGLGARKTVLTHDTLLMLRHHCNKFGYNMLNSSDHNYRPEKTFSEVLTFALTLTLNTEIQPFHNTLDAACDDVSSHKVC